MEHKQPAQPEEQTTTLDIRVRDMPAEVWEEARIAAIREKKSMGPYLADVLSKHLGLATQQSKSEIRS